MKDLANRNEQFENIERLKKVFEELEQPIISMDTKKKELLGDFYRASTVYIQAQIEAYDHDFPSFAQGKAIPVCLTYSCFIPKRLDFMTMYSSF
jgi:hypothetical protein